MAGIPAVERAWGALLESTSMFHLKTTCTFVVHEVSFWSAFVPFLIFDRIPALRKYKLQPDKPASRETYARCVTRLVITHLCLVLPIVMATHPILDLMGAPHTVESLPTLPTALAQVALFFVMEDCMFYFGHRALHTPFLYRHVHSIHHEHSAPFGITAEYAHPFEVMFLGMSTILPPLLFGPHLFTLYLYLCLRCLQTVECHSGYDLPFSPNKFIPGYGGARFHDHHHRIHSGNLSSTFIWMDWLAGTDAAYRHWEKKQAVAAARKKLSAE